MWKCQLSCCSNAGELSQDNNAAAALHSPAFWSQVITALRKLWEVLKLLNWNLRCWRFSYLFFLSFIIENSICYVVVSQIVSWRLSLFYYLSPFLNNIYCLSILPKVPSLCFALVLFYFLGLFTSVFVCIIDEKSHGVSQAKNEILEMHPNFWK